MRKLSWMLAGAFALCIVVGVGCGVFLKTRANGFSARCSQAFLKVGSLDKPAPWHCQPMRKHAQIPSGTHQEVLAAARAHWADHCAACHSNNGSGDSEMGKHMYPPAPDMRQADTQNLTDGELFYIIQNGIRLTDDASWGGGVGHDKQDS